MSSLLVLVLILISSVGEGQPESDCGVEPQTLTLLWGSDADVTCSSSCVPGQVFWTLNKRRLDESRTIDSTHNLLTLRNFRLNSATLQCHSAQTLQVLGGVIVRAYTKPDTLRCMWHYKDKTVGGMPELFTCTWNHTQHPGNINYTLLRAGVELCRSQLRTCTVSSVKVPVSRATVSVRAQTAEWEAESGPQEFYMSENLKMVRPRLNVTVFSTHLLAEWTAMPRLGSKPVRCQVKSHEFVQNVNLTQGGKGSLNVTDVDSCSNYTLSVRCAYNVSFWSDWSGAVTVLTQINKKKMNLRLWREIRAPGSDGRRDVVVMWKPIPTTCRGTFTFVLKHEGYLEETSCGNSTCEVSVDQNQHTLHLLVFDGAALLVEESVHVPASGEPAPRVSDLQTWTHDGSIVVSWRPPPGSPSGYMLDWTHDGSRYDWDRTSNFNFTLTDLLDMKPYDITVTPLLGGKTGGASSAERVCSRVGDPGLVSILDVQAKHTSAIVSWSVTPQDVCGGVIVDFTVTYRTDAEPEQNVSVNHSQHKVVLDHLTPDTQYRLHVKANSLTGSSKSSEWLSTTKRFDPSIVKVLSICGSIAIILILSVGLFCAVQCRKFKEKPVPDPSLSSLALWSGLDHDKTQQHFLSRQPFHNPTESVCERVHAEELDSGDSLSTSATEASDRTTTSTLFTVKQMTESSSGDWTALLSTESSSSNPYRSQNSGEIPACKSKGKKSSVTTYVTLDMFEDDTLRERK